MVVLSSLVLLLVVITNLILTLAISKMRKDINELLNRH